ncbi:MAG: Folylpolyglutamate synthase [Planctomycetes bacterium]|nr:Folylpolyglutamate synthase [Planctomycetota bacterium]HRJ77986.1 folylpolyglutamate synthase/dihydrofolate synthase family protein [Planctomycetota bacterium]
MPIRTLKDVLAFLNQRTDYEKQLGGRTRDTFDLERMNEVCDALGRPDLAYAAAHIAGTKGKGSTSRYLAAALRSQGLKVGLFTSPHLERLNERIEVNGKPLSDARFAKAFARVVETLEAELGGGRDITFFELLTLCAMVAFRDAGVDVAVWEVGLGGRLDATNVVSPAVCIITEIGLDHTRQLGDTIAEIAREKAGIIKPGVPVVCAAQHPDAVRVITLCARDAEAPLIHFGRDYHLRDFSREYARVTFSAAIRDVRYEHLELPTPARHLAENACHALAALEILNADESILPGPLDRAAVAKALAQTAQPGRFEMFAGHPPVVIDSAHNEVSLKATMQTARAIHKGRLVLVVGVAQDKDLEACLPPLALNADGAVFTSFASPRATDPQTLASLYVKFGGPGAEVAKSPKAALALARKMAGQEGMVLVTGSTYLAGELRSQAAKG